MNRQRTAAELEARGTSRPDRPRGEPHPNAPKVTHIAGNPERPAWLKGTARKIWDIKVARYLARGQSVKGCEDALAQYCCLEAHLNDKFWRKDITPPMAMTTAHRLYAIEFFDTPHSQTAPSKGNAPSNPFSRNKREP